MRGLEKNRMGRGQTDRQTDTQTIRLLDQLGPEGRVGENAILYKRYAPEIIVLIAYFFPSLYIFALVSSYDVRENRGNKSLQHCITLCQV